jgi:hypothetical protein
MTDSNPPPEFDLIKELNNHGGRLTALLALAVATLAFSLATSPLKDTLTPFDLARHPFVYGALAVVGLCLYLSFSGVINTLTPPTPVVRLAMVFRLQAGIREGWGIPILPEPSEPTANSPWKRLHLPARAKSRPINSSRSEPRAK